MGCYAFQVVVAQRSAKSAKCQVLKSWSDIHVFAQMIARPANLSFQTGKFPTCYKRVQNSRYCCCCWRRPVSTVQHNELYTDLQTVNGVKILERLVLARLLQAVLSVDLSAAFDTDDHSLLIKRLKSELGMIDMLLDWLRAYLGDREQFV